MKKLIAVLYFIAIVSIAIGTLSAFFNIWSGFIPETRWGMVAISLLLLLWLENYRKNNELDN